MDGRLSSIRAEVDAGTVTAHSLVLLFNVTSDAGHAGDIATLEQTLGLARAISQSAGAGLQGEADRLVIICEQTLANAGQRQPGDTGKPPDGIIVCPGCGNEVPASAVRCRRCGHLFI